MTGHIRCFLGILYYRRWWRCDKFLNTKGESGRSLNMSLELSVEWNWCFKGFWLNHQCRDARAKWCWIQPPPAPPPCPELLSQPWLSHWPGCSCLRWSRHHHPRSREGKNEGSFHAPRACQIPPPDLEKDRNKHQFKVGSVCHDCQD